MTLEAIYFISQVIAAGAIVASLIFVGIQIRGQTRQARREARQGMLLELRGIMSPLATNSDLAAAYAMALMDGWEALSTTQKIQLGGFVASALRSNELLYHQYLDGAVEQEIWQASWAQMSEAIGNPVFANMWANRQHHYTERFRDLVNSRTPGAYRAGLMTESLQSANAGRASEPVPAKSDGA